MMRWNREAAMLGIPDLPEEGFKHVGDRKIKPQGGGGGGSQESTSYTSSVPKWLESEQKDLVARGFALGQQPYQPYTGERVSQFTPLQRMAFGQAERQQVSPQIGEATGLAGLAARQGLQAGQFQTGQFTPMGVQAPQLQQFQLGAPMGVGTQSFTQPGMAQQFMDPYMQNVVNIQQQAAQRQADIQATQRGAQAVRAGAFGGSRQAIENAEANRALASQMGEIQARGLQDAFGRAQEQFGREQQLGLQAQLANQQAGLTAGQANLQSLLGVQQLGAQTGMQAQLANQQALADAQRAFEQSRQFGAELGLRGGAQALQGAQTLGQLGQQRFGQEMDIMGRQRDFGAQQQQQIQRILDQQFADFQAQRDFPYQQLGFMSDLIQGRGGSTRQMYTVPQPSALQTVAGLGTAAAGIAGMAKGGEVGYADGGITGLLGDRELAQTAQNPSYGPMMQMAAQDQMAENAALRAAAPQGLPGMQPETAGNAEAVLTQKMVEALNRGDKRLAEELAEALEEIKVQQEVGGIAGVMPEQMAEDIPEGGIMEMAMGGEVQTFSNGGSPYVRRNEETDALIASPTRSVASTPQMMFGTFDINKARAQEEEALRESQKEAVARQDEALKRHKDFYAGLGALGAEKEQRIREDLAGEEGRKDQAKSMALLQTGLAILSADPSRGGLAAIGEGAGVGLGAYKGDLKDLEKRRERMTDKLDELAILRRQEATANNEGLERIYARRDQVLDSFAKDFRNLGTKYGIDVPMENAKFMAERADRLNIAKIQSDRRTEGERLRDELKQHKPGSPEYNRILQDIEAISIAQNAGKPDTNMREVVKSTLKELEQANMFLKAAKKPEDIKRRQDEVNAIQARLDELLSGGRGSSTSQSSGTVDTSNPLLGP